MEDWEIKRREELEKEIPSGDYLSMKSKRYSIWIGRETAIEYQISLEKEIRKILIVMPLT